MCEVSIAPLWNWKNLGFSFDVPCNDVSIAPLWNWKQTGGPAQRPLSLFQSHLYGIESCPWMDCNAVPSVSIAPLWNWKKGETLPSLKCNSFNRTFMELKVDGGIWIRHGEEFQSHLYGIESVLPFNKLKSLLVSIAPLWNWKDYRERFKAEYIRFNRTFMELKVPITIIIRCPITVSIAPLWNWKTNLNDVIDIILAGFNRTFMELKEKKRRKKYPSMEVSIAPLWNWKRRQEERLVEQELFQSHLYGIESLYWNDEELADDGFNRTFMELKATRLQQPYMAAMFQSHLYPKSVIRKSFLSFPNDRH